MQTVRFLNDKVKIVEVNATTLSEVLLNAGAEVRTMEESNDQYVIGLDVHQDYSDGSWQTYIFYGDWES